MVKLKYTALITPAILLSACAVVEKPNVTAPDAVRVAAIVETDIVGTSNDDAADDPAIWRNADLPSASLIVGTDKKAGLYVYDLLGKERSFQPAGNINNVDIREPGDGDTARIIVGASNRNEIAKPQISLFTLNPQTAALSPLADIFAGTGEAYGFCFGRASATELNAILITKEGGIFDVAIDMAKPVPTGVVKRSMRVGTQAEGCVVDTATNMLYVGEENVGIWSFNLNDAAPAAMPFAMLKAGEMTADVEGLALATAGGGAGYLVASSQGDNSYAVYDLQTKAFKGRFAVADGAIDATSDTDGIELMLGDFGPSFPGGIFVAQDGTNSEPGQSNTPKQATQNFKYLSWDSVKAALNLD